ncbi:ASCH domain-containing protein [Archaeoglobus neptunius]|uniref:hypothetical protein n=1 Tax=Archaeoglobus neptunius TaxID=2798580 RepID=UPI001926140E|nr:hypothetical protein [Archaeoglobus neptunius]
MVAISFSTFRDKLLSGEKDQTIRPYSENRYHLLKVRRKRIQVYWKQRTKECEKLFEAEPTEVFTVFLDPDSHCIYRYDDHVGKTWIPVEEQEEIVRRDGFRDVEEFFEFFTRMYGEEYLWDNIFMVIRFRKLDGGR